MKRSHKKTKLYHRSYEHLHTCLSQCAGGRCRHSWKRMYLEHPHLRCDGIYVSRNTYFRLGIVHWDVKNPVHLVVYYRSATEHPAAPRNTVFVATHATVTCDHPRTGSLPHPLKAIAMHQAILLVQHVATHGHPRHRAHDSAPTCRYFRFFADGTVLTRTSPDILRKVAPSLTKMPHYLPPRDSRLPGRWKLQVPPPRPPFHI